MHPEKLGFEDCDINSIFKVIDKETQTNQANTVKNSESSVKSYKLPLPRELEKPEEGAIKVFSFCQVIQDPDCPKSITIVRESVTEEVHTHSDSPNNEAFSNRYRYCKEVIKPYLKDYPPDCPDSGELLLRDAIITANEEFPEYPPCYEVPVNESDVQPEHKTKQDGKYIAPIPSKKSDKPAPPKKSYEKDIKPRRSKKDLVPSVSGKKSDKDVCKTKSDHKLTCKKSDKDLVAKKSDKNLDKKQSKKDIAPCPSKKSNKDLAEKKTGKDLCSKKSDKHLSSKKSDKDLAGKSGSCLPVKKSDKDLSSKTSGKDLPPKKGDKESSKKSHDSLQSPDKKERRHLILCPGQKVPKICIEITDPKLCPENLQPGFRKDSEKSDDKCYRGGESRDDKRYRDQEGGGGKCCKEEKGRGSKRYREEEDICEGKSHRGDKRRESKRYRDEEDCEDKRYRKRSREDKRYREEDCSEKSSKRPRKPSYHKDREDSGSYQENEECVDKSRRQRSSGRKSEYCHDREDSDSRRSEEEGRSERPRKRPCVKKSEKRPRSEDFGCREDPPAEKSYHSERPYKKPSQVIPSRPRKEFDEDCQEDFYPPELCIPDDEESCNCPRSQRDDCPPRKPEKEICEPKEDKSSKSQKYCWPPSIGTKDNTSKKDGPSQPHRKDCLGKLLESLRIISSDAESCTRKAAKSHPELPPKKPTDPPSSKSSDKPLVPPPIKPSDKPPESPSNKPRDSSSSKMADRPSENPPRKCKPRSKTPPGSGLPIDDCVKESRSTRKVCKRKSSKSDVRKTDSGTKVDGKRSKTGAAAAAGAGACKVDEMVKGQLVQVQAEAAKLGPCTCTSNAVKVKSAIDAHHETLATLKCAMEDFMCKVFRSTQDAVTLITSESAKQLQKLRKSASNTSDDCKPPKKVSDTHSNQNLRRFSLVNIDNPNDVANDKKKLPDCVPQVNVRENSPLKYLDALVSKVDSAVSIISESLVFEIPKPMKPRSFNDVSSEYDIPHSTRPMPKDIENIIDPEGTSSMFTTLKDKLWAMFIEDDKTDIEIASVLSTESVTSESDEDLINKMID